MVGWRRPRSGRVRSLDGGQTWSQNFAEFSQCSDDGDPGYTSPFPRATDPWVSFDSAGRAYQISLIDRLTSDSRVSRSRHPPTAVRPGTRPFG